MITNKKSNNNALNQNYKNSKLNYKKIHEENENYINNTLKFKSLWQDKCSKHNVQVQPSVLPPVRRIIVIGDIHGDLKMTYETLRIAKLIDASNNWCGGDTVVVQVGDQIDRCRYTKIPCHNINATIDDEGNDYIILQYFTELHNQAQKVGGAVYSLLGNHELLNVEQNLNYVSYKGLQEFDNYNIPGTKTIIENGKTARLWAFQKGNPISEFLACTRQVALIIGSNLFVHAGILPEIASKYNVSSLNKLMTLYLFNELNNNDNKYNDIFFSEHYSPLWNRKFGNINVPSWDINGHLENINTKCKSLLDPLEEIYKVKKIYVGHTPSIKKGISSFCNEKLWLTDYGLSSAFNKFDYNNTRSKSRNAHVLEILNDGEQFNILKADNNI